MHGGERKPRARADLDRETLSLSKEEGLLLSRVDGATPVKDLGRLTGLSNDQVTRILRRLERQGVIDLGDDEGGTREPVLPTKESVGSAGKRAGARSPLDEKEVAPVDTL